MAATQAKERKETVQFWLPDPADLQRLLELLEICGYTDESYAREEASEEGESSSLIEVTVKTREIINPQPWHEEFKWQDELRDGIWHA